MAIGPLSWVLVYCADIHKMHVKSRKLTQLTKQEFTPNTGVVDKGRRPEGVYNLGPCPLPGGKIMFTSNRNGRYEVFVMPAEGGPAVAVPGHGEREDYASWHPDDRRLVLVAERQGRCDLYMAEVG